MRLLVKYDFRSGEDETCSEVLIQGKGKAVDIVHSKFKNFRNETTTIEKGRVYLRDNECPMVKITG